MRIYLELFIVTIKRYFVYRLSFILWRVRMFIGLIIIFFLWNAVFDKNQQFATYSKGALLSYILYVNVIATLVLGTRTADIAANINDGTIINYLLKPISFFRYFAMEDVADKLLNLVFALFEVWLLMVVFKPPIAVPSNFLAGFIFLINGVCISFFINLMLSFVAFWTTETWAARFVYLMIIGFVSGSFFPLDLFPQWIYQILLLTPFPYLFYLPAKTLLGHTDKLILWEYFFSFFWVFVAWRLAKLMWKLGNKSFSFWGK